MDIKRLFEISIEKAIDEQREYHILHMCDFKEEYDTKINTYISELEKEKEQSETRLIMRRTVPKEFSECHTLKEQLKFLKKALSDQNERILEFEKTVKDLQKRMMYPFFPHLDEPKGKKNMCGDDGVILD